MRSLLAAVGSASIFVLSGVTADDLTHRYKENEPVDFYVHKVGPLANPQEAYPYYDLPFCAPKSFMEKEEVPTHSLFNIGKVLSLAEQLGGHVLHHSGHTIQFAGHGLVEGCKTTLTVEAVEKFNTAVREEWFYQMYIDDLPIWGMVGEIVNGKPNVYATRKLVIAFNKDRIIHVDMVPVRSSLTELTPGTELTFTTTFEWKETEVKFEHRFHRYLDNKFFKHQIHWFSIFNSFMMVLFLTGLVSLIMVRTLRRDYARYSITGEGDDYDDETGPPAVDENGKPLLDEDGNPVVKSGGGGGGMPSEDSGWKQVHGDVFRAPWMLTLVAAFLGSGWQLIILTLGVILFAMMGPIHGEVHEDRGEMEHVILCCYSLSGVVAGYASGRFFKMYTATRRSGKNAGGREGSSWQVVMMLTAILLPTMIGISVIFLNAIALSYGTINYIPFFALVKLFLLYIFISAPLCIVGTLVGRHGKADSGRAVNNNFPCRVNAIPRPIPESVPWYGKPTNLIPFAGLLSFGSIFIELYYVLTSLWNYKIYHVYGFLLGVNAIMIVVVSMTTIIVVYFCLNAENYLWQWIAIGSGGSVGGYVFLYGVYFFMFKTDMHGFLQTVYYFSYMSLIALSLGTVCGTIAHASASKFVRTIFKNVKVD